MKVAYFLGALNRGGLESLIFDVCRQHKKVPYSFVCIYRHEGNMSEDFKASGADLIQIQKKYGLLRYLYDIRNTLKREQITIVHSQTPSNTLLLGVALIGTKIHIVTTFHGHLFATAPFWQRKIVYDASEKILCVSEYQKRYYEERWKLPKENKLDVVYNGIDFSKIDTAVKSEELNVNSKIRLAMVGNFIKGRSQLVIAKAIERLDALRLDAAHLELPDFDFYFIGKRDDRDPERYDNCIKYCDEKGLRNVHFLGSRNDVPSILKSIDGFVYSTEHDTFGIAVIEAIVSGLPVVVNDWPVMKEVSNLNLPEANNAIRLFKTNDVADCAKQIAQLIIDIKENGVQVMKDAQMASSRARNKYAVQKHIEKLNEIYQLL